MDLVIESRAGPVVLVCGAGWDVASGDRRSRSWEHRGHRGELISSHAAVRTHPLRAGEWLNGPVTLGPASALLHARITLQPEEQRIRVLLPLGTNRVAIPATRLSGVRLDGHELASRGSGILFDPPLESPTTFEFATGSGRLGGALTGPSY